MIWRVSISLLLVCASLCAGEEYTYWIEPCAAGSAACEAGDPELARWAFDAWQRESKGGLALRAVGSEAHARLRLYWTGGRSGLYGEARPRMVDGQPGADIYVLPAAQPEKLTRDAVVYLTCVHEIGHALGLPHTERFEDIMYTFSLGGDIQEYFGRYRRLLKARSDIRLYSGVSDADRKAIQQKHPAAAR